MNIQRITTVLVILFIIAGVLIVVLDWGEVKTVIARANWPVLASAILFTTLSYTCLSCELALSFRTFGIPLGFGYLMQVGFVSNVVTYLLNVGGVTGLSLQFLLVKKRNLATQDIFAASLFQLFFSSMLLIVLLPIGLSNVVGNPHISSATSLALAVVAGVLAFLLVAAGVIVFVGVARRAVLQFVTRLVRLVIRKDVGRQLTDFDAAMSRGLSLMRKRPAVFAAMLGLTIGDWTSTMTALWFCFLALGIRVAPGTLITGFSLGVTAGFLSFVPGGLGVQEGSMAGIYALLGIPLTTAVLAAILFRIVYYFLPFLVSLTLYRHLLKSPG